MSRLIAAVVVWCVLALCGCSESNNAAAPAASPPSAAATPLRLAIDQWPGYYPAVLADDLGYFADLGLQVEIELPGDTDRMLAEFAAGRYELIGVALGDLITLSRERDDVAVLLVSDESAGGDALLAAAGYTSDPEAPLRIGTNLGGFGELFVRELLPRMQIDASRVEWINVDASDVPQALAEGRLDLGHCWEPYASQAEALGARRLYSSADTPGLIPDVVATTGRLAELRGADLQAFGRAWFRAVEWWRQHPQQAAERIEKRLALPAGGADLRGIELQDRDANARLLGAHGGPAELAPVIDRYSRFFVTRGRLLQPMSSERLLLPELLP